MVGNLADGASGATTPASAPITTALRRVNWTIAALTVIGFAMRAWGADWQLPWLLHFDEPRFVGGAIEMLRSGDLNPHYFRNPTLFTYWLTAQFWLTGVLGTLVGALPAPADVLNASSSPALYLLARLNSALLGAATVWATWRLGTLVASRSVGLMAAALLALNFLHARDSHYASNDIAATFLLMLSAVWVARVSREPTLNAYLLAGALGGLATGTKYNVGLFFVPLLVAHVLAWRGQMLSPRAFGRLLVAGGASLALFVASNPYVLLDVRSFVTDFRGQIGNGSLANFGQSAEPVWLLYLLTLAQAMGLAQLLLVGAGAATTLIRDRRTLALIGAFPLAYFAFMAPKSWFYVRFALPLLPWLCLLAALGIRELVSIARTQHRPALLVALLLIALAQPTLLIVQHNLLVGREDTRILAARWAADHLAANGTILTEGHGLALPGGRDEANGLRIVTRDRVHERDERQLQQRGYRFVVTSSFVQDRYGMEATIARLKDPDAVKGTLTEKERDRALRFASEHHPIATFGPGPAGGPLPFNLDDAYTPFWNPGAWERPGPTIAIYELD